MTQKIVTISIESTLWESFRAKLVKHEGLDKGVISAKIEELITKYIHET